MNKNMGVKMTQENIPRKLYRSRVNRMIAGVCGGMAEYFSIDVTVVRVLWVLASLWNGIGVVAYLIFLILTPDNPEQKDLPVDRKIKSQNTGLIIGIVLIALGLSLILRHPFGFFWHYHWPFFWGLPFDWDLFGPIALILFGVWFIFYTMQKDRDRKQNADETVATVSTEEKKFHRSKSMKMIGGICGGLAELWNVDVTLIRVGLVLLALATNIIMTVIVYIIVMIIVPEEEKAIE